VPAADARIVSVLLETVTTRPAAVHLRGSLPQLQSPQRSPEIFHIG